MVARGGDAGSGLCGEENLNLRVGVVDRIANCRGYACRENSFEFSVTGST